MPLGKRTDYGDAKYAGVVLPFSSDIAQAVEPFLLCGFDFVVAPLVRDDYRPPPLRGATGGQLAVPFQKDDVLYLSGSQWASQVVGQISVWIDPDSPDAGLRRDSSLVLRQELAWAAHLGLQAVVLPAVPQPNNAPNYAQVLNQALQGLTHMALWLTVPLGPADPTPAEVAAQADGSGPAPASSGTSAMSASDPWQSWHQVRTLCEHNNLLGCVLVLPPTLPAPQMMARWLGEPVKAVMVPTAVFTTNKRGYPVLPKAHQDIICTFLRHQVQVIVTGPAKHTPPATAATATAAATNGQKQIALDPQLNFAINDPGEQHPLRPYWEYMCFLFRKLEELGEQDRLEASYRDYLQAPLQPLQDNLESQTYETFEKDVTKYTLYEEAVYRALLDRTVPEPSTSNPDGSTVIMVVGAGRGPLVRASMKAGQRAGRPLRLYAVEKNPNAIVHIQSMLMVEGWQDKVTIVSADMRHWQAPEQADILVSELLGSFGDNELSPECLDGAQRFLRTDGISVPQSYTSFLAPVTTHKLYNDVRAYKDLEHAETPYVVKFHRHHLLAPTQAFFTFDHPNLSASIDNSRYKSTTFQRDPAAGAGILHGFAGYFECSLYKDVLLSIHPPTHSVNMFSWFPIFFPLRDPVYLPAGAPVCMQMWRCVAAHKVWYEWSATAPVSMPIHNVGGRSYWVGL